MPRAQALFALALLGCVGATPASEPRTAPTSIVNGEPDSFFNEVVAVT